jgi:hypothetical protein
LWWLVLLSLHVLHSVGEVLDQLHLRFERTTALPNPLLDWPVGVVLDSAD